ncbi:hypothetical protein HSBAA_56320 [Vreelandella sulfidaeris]|uniref:SsuA/THI5-like domain-containing protein n=1 Tax=Vreelandella sulfidaeris TaxID=115553 RepID=A0A455UDK0_9GAMM|nr:hypothetical protein HSBAA_56320 [Halomonas sulfidaeris]
MPLSRKLNITLAALSLSVASGVFAASAQADTLRVGMSGGYFPLRLWSRMSLRALKSM